MDTEVQKSRPSWKRVWRASKKSIVLSRRESSHATLLIINYGQNDFICETEEGPLVSKILSDFCQAHWLLYEFVVVQAPSCVRLFETPWIAARQASLSLTISQRLPKIMFIETVMPSNYLILCHPLLLLPSIFPSFRAFSNESALCIRCPKYWSFTFSISVSKE